VAVLFNPEMLDRSAAPVAVFSVPVVQVQSFVSEGGIPVASRKCESAPTPKLVLVGKADAGPGCASIKAARVRSIAVRGEAPFSFVILSVGKPIKHKSALLFNKI
jgi:hypothetical protein